MAFEQLFEIVRDILSRPTVPGDRASECDSPFRPVTLTHQCRRCGLVIHVPAPPAQPPERCPNCPSLEVR